MFKHQHAKFQKILKHVWVNSAFYREYYSSHGIREKALPEVGVEDLPFLTKKILMDNFDAAVSDPRLRMEKLEQWIQNDPDPQHNFDNDFIVLHSSGSSGNIGIFVYDWTAWRIANSTVANHIPPPDNYLSGKTKVAVYLASHGHFAAVSTSVRVPATIYDTLILSVLSSSQNVVAELNAFQPHRLGGYASSVAMLADLALQGKLRIRPQSILVGGDLLTQGMKQRIQEAWGAPIHEMYAASESIYLAIKTSDQQQMVILDDLNILEILDQDNHPVPPGESGRVVLTNLYNYTLPVLRYELGDYVVRGKGELDARAATIQNIRGRMNDALPVVLDNAELDSIHPIILSEFYAAGLDKVQFISRRPDHVCIDYVARQNVDDGVRNAFRRILDMKGAHRMTFEVRRVQQIDPDPKTGKPRMVKIEKGKNYSANICSEQPVSKKDTVREDAPKPAFDTTEESDLQQAIIAKCVHPSGTFVEFEKEQVERSIPERFEQMAAKHAGRLAVKTSNAGLTYRELNHAANRLARAISAECKTGQEPIALLLDHGIDAVIGVLGVLKAGKICVPLDPSYPGARIDYVMRDTEAGLIVTSNKHLSLASERLSVGCRLINIDELDSKLSDENLGLPISPRDLAYILYSSGSTGKPKGVMHNHRDLLHSVVASGNPCRYCPDDRISLFASISSAHGGMTIFSALLYGAALCLWNIREQGLADLARWLMKEEITIFLSSPTVFRNFVATLSGGENFPRLRLIRLGSEPVNKSDVELYKRHFSPDCVLVHILASAEAMHVANYFIDGKTDICDGVVPVGYPVEGKKILILDDDGKELGFGDGEIAVKSDYLFPGYWRNAELTQAVLLPDPEGGSKKIYRTGDVGRVLSDGRLKFLGRKDFRVKIRGYGVDPREIEVALQGHSAVRESVVAAVDDDHQEKRLVAYIVLKDGFAETVRGLRKFLEQKFPEYMVPSAFVQLDALPLLPNGKVDRQALPPPGPVGRQGSTPYAPPVETVEHQLVQIWEEILGVSPIGIQDDFFELGGNSLIAAQMIPRIEQVCGVNLSLSILFRGLTIEKLGKALVEERVKGAESLLIEIQSRGAEAPLFFLHGDWYGGGFYCLNLARCLGEDQPFYALTPFGLNGREVPPTIEAMAAYYIEMIRAVAPRGPYVLGGLCHGGIIAFEMAQQLLWQGQKVNLVLMIGPPTFSPPFMRRVKDFVSGVGYLLGLGPEKEMDLFLALQKGWVRLRRIYLHCAYRWKEVKQLTLGRKITWALRLTMRAILQTLRIVARRRTIGPYGIDPNDEAHRDDLYKTYYRRLAGYVRRPYSGRVGIFWPTDEAVMLPGEPPLRWEELTDQTLGWDRVVDELEVYALPGGYTTSITTHVQTLANQVKACLDRMRTNSNTVKLVALWSIPLSLFDL